MGKIRSILYYIAQHNVWTDISLLKCEHIVQFLAKVKTNIFLLYLFLDDSISLFTLINWFFGCFFLEIIDKKLIFIGANHADSSLKIFNFSGKCIYHFSIVIALEWIILECVFMASGYFQSHQVSCGYLHYIQFSFY